MGQPSILVIEDDPTEFLLLERAFQEAQIVGDIHWSQSGHQALTYLKDLELTGKPVPVLILSDLKMPLMDGLDLLKIIKADPLLRTIPFVMLTNSAHESDISRCYQSGANSYLVKPSALDGLVEVSRALRAYWISFNQTASGRSEPPDQDVPPPT